MSRRPCSACCAASARARSRRRSQARRAVRAVRRADLRRSTTTSSTCRRARSMCACRGCFLLFTPEGAGGQPLQGGARPVPRVHRSPAHAEPVGRAADPGVGRVLLRELDDRSRRRLLPEPGRRDRVVALARRVGRASSVRTPSSRRCCPTSRRSSSAPIERRRRSRSTSCRSTRATSSSAISVGSGKASTEVQRLTRRSSCSSSGCETGRGCDRVRRSGSRCSTHAPSRTPRFPRSCSAPGSASTPGRRCTRSRCGARSASNPSGAATSTRRRSGLVELFGEPNRWGDSLRPFLWTHVATTVTTFTGETEIDLPMTCTYDFEIASTKFLHSLDDGEVPLVLLFAGSAFTRSETRG